MNARQIELVTSTFAAVRPIADIAATLFYERLFELDPSLRRLFPVDLTQQRKHLMQMIGVAVANLNSLEAIVPTIEQLGRRHVGYGVRDEHFDVVGAALLWTLERGLGDAFTAEARDAWTAVYMLLASVMKAGAAEAAMRFPQAAE